MNFLYVSDFGGIDADADELLRSCFQSHPAYLQAKAHRRFLVVGRKGSGKTSIYKKLITPERHDAFSFGYTFDDYPWSHHDLQAQNGVPEERRYVHSWKYLCLMGFSKILLNSDNSQPWSEESQEALAAIETFILDSYGSRNPDLTQLFSPAKELKLKGKLKTRYLEIEGERIRVKDLPIHIQGVNQFMTDQVIAAMNPSIDYYICLDQLDHGFSTTEPQYFQRLTGLIISARDICIKAREAGKRASVVVFLRDDIYQAIQFEDKNKITENHMSLIQWTQSDGMTLKSLMERRFGEVFRGSGTVPWNDVFDESKEMPSRQSKYAHICDRTFLRPRDMVKFCNAILESHKQLGFSDSSKFDNGAVHAAREAYSDYLLNELDDEIHKHVPNYKEYLEVLKTIASTTFSFDEFKKAWEQRSTLATTATSPMQALQQLFEFSVIGYLRSGGGGGGSQYVWRYKDPRARFSEGAETFRVHAGFKESLDLTAQSKR